MADIFISYSKADRDKVLMLSAYLESEGWTVWWDTNLTPGDTYRDEIMKQLAAARAVIILWTQTSIKSDFVRAEAGRAKADGKLIPVKDTDVAYGDIPLPFGEMHTEDLSKRELIRAAVVAQLEKPQVQPRALWVATKTLRYQALTWIGIVGGTITLYSHFKDVLDLADWSRWLVVNWSWVTTKFWNYFVRWMGVRLSPYWASLLTFVIFTLSIVVGVRMRSAIDKPPALESAHQIRIRRRLRRVPTFVVVAMCVVLVALQFDSDISTLSTPEWVFSHALVVVTFLLFGFFLRALLRAGLYTSKNAYGVFHLLLFYFVYPIFCMQFMQALATDQPSSYGDMLVRLFGLLIAGLVPGIAMATLAPISALNKRLSFLALGVLTLVTLNQISLYAPDIRQWLKPPA
jgi:hypothetical protein